MAEELSRAVGFTVSLDRHEHVVVSYSHEIPFIVLKIQGIRTQMRAKAVHGWFAATANTTETKEENGLFEITTYLPITAAWYEKHRP